jgi:hypothetical protein
MANRLTTLFDFDSNAGIKSIKNIQTEIRNADGLFGKMKAGGAASFEALKANAGNFALVAGTAIAGFGATALKTFADTGIAAGKFAEATGLGVEAASRWIEVASDVGVGADTMQGAFVKLNKELAGGSPLADKLGLSLKKTADGAVDVNATMLEAIRSVSAIADPTERAAAASTLFGRNFAEASEIVFAGAENMEAALAGVSDQQVIDEEELAKAREMRERMDQMSDAMDRAKLAAGEFLFDFGSKLKDVGTELGRFVGDLAGVNSPEARSANDAIVQGLEEAEAAAAAFDKTLLKGVDTYDEARAVAAKYADGLADTTDKTHAANLITNDWATSQEQLQTKLASTSGAMDIINADIEAAKESFRRFGSDGVENMGRVEDASGDAKDEVNELKEAFEDLRDELSDRSAYLDLKDSFDEVESAAQEAWDTAAAGADNAEAKARDHEQAIIDMKGKVMDYAEELGNVPAETVTSILALIDQGKLSEAEAALDRLSQPRNVAVSVRVSGGGGVFRSADGNYNTPSGPHVINDGLGGELVELPGGSKVMTAANTRNYLGQMNGGTAATMMTAVHFHTHVNNVVASGSPDHVAATLNRRLRGRL